MRKPLCCLIVWLAIFALVNGCVRHSTADSSVGTAAAIGRSKNITALHEGRLTLPAQSDAPKLIYVDVQENARLAPRLAEHLGAALAADNFRLADAPSKAGHILHVNIVQEGQGSAASVRNAVKAGYGQKARFSGTGVRAMLADALMVQRKVPSHKRPSRARMKNASTRNALGSAQMRVAVLGPDKKTSLEDFSRAMAGELARSIEFTPSFKQSPKAKQ